ncbi:hypothetical protein [Candidatus Epulonipiscium viviparus]|uniref:hypothetical protein n=1 Tax=Candidatus Epulonipiscium viviparus TaxID=420336 RepID=UPI00273808E8|nr:hypothetical protein [Candidatus Epulopiscium viviparus]
MKPRDYNYTYHTILCIKTKLSDNIKQYVDFQKGVYYPFSCVSFENNGKIDTSRVVQIISESGYKKSLKDEELLEHFNVENIIANKFMIKR